MAKQVKTKKQQEIRGQASQKNRQTAPPNASPGKQQGKVRRFFVVLICVIVALGLMLPTAGLGFASCSMGFGIAAYNPNSTTTP